MVCNACERVISEWEAGGGERELKGLGLPNVFATWFYARRAYFFTTSPARKPKSLPKHPKIGILYKIGNLLFLLFPLKFLAYYISNRFGTYLHICMIICNVSAKAGTKFYWPKQSLVPCNTSRCHAVFVTKSVIISYLSSGRNCRNMMWVFTSHILTLTVKYSKL